MSASDYVVGCICGATIRAPAMEQISEEIQRHVKSCEALKVSGPAGIGGGESREGDS